jgi:dienelactone hydrolase
MRRIIEYYAIGHQPPPPGRVTGRELKSQPVLEGKALFRLVHLSFGPEDKLGFDVAIFTPAGAVAPVGPFPTVVQPSFDSTPGIDFTPLTNATGKVVFKAVTPEAAVTQYAQALGRGYAVLTFYYQQCGADNRTNRQSGFFPAYPDYDWGDLAAWAWGMSRCVDYLEQQPYVDRAKIIAVGHSRLGKATLVAGALDERFALVAPAGSGCGGTGAYRFNGQGRGGKEGLEDATRKFPQWFGPRLAQFSGQVEKLPFDQHWLMDLVAPRAFIATDGLDDATANENALVQAWLAARPVYALLGVPDHLGIHFRPGKHLLAPEDWTAILDFADQQLRGLKVSGRFDQLPPAGQLH